MATYVLPKSAVPRKFFLGQARFVKKPVHVEPNAWNPMRVEALPAATMPPPDSGPPPARARGALVFERFEGQSNENEDSGRPGGGLRFRSSASAQQQRYNTVLATPFLSVYLSDRLDYVKSGLGPRGPYTWRDSVRYGKVGIDGYGQAGVRMTRAHTKAYLSRCWREKYVVYDSSRATPISQGETNRRIQHSKHTTYDGDIESMVRYMNYAENFGFLVGIFGLGINQPVIGIATIRWADRRKLAKQ
ncbi:hypothetical protein EDB87DRAFT_1579394 [Lactarius vividus]|nr:hypothetical protein EDB87DRAFT_1579394 [Lactarius vividus]